MRSITAILYRPSDFTSFCAATDRPDSNVTKSVPINTCIFIYMVGLTFGKRRQSAIGNRQSAIGNRQSAIGNRQSAIEPRDNIQPVNLSAGLPPAPSGGGGGNTTSLLYSTC